MVVLRQNLKVAIARKLEQLVDINGAVRIYDVIEPKRDYVVNVLITRVVAGIPQSVYDGANLCNKWISLGDATHASEESESVQVSRDFGRTAENGKAMGRDAESGFVWRLFGNVLAILPLVRLIAVSALWLATSAAPVEGRER